MPQLEMHLHAAAGAPPPPNSPHHSSSSSSPSPRGTPLSPANGSTPIGSPAGTPPNPPAYHHNLSSASANTDYGNENQWDDLPNDDEEHEGSQQEARDDGADYYRDDTPDGSPHVSDREWSDDEQEEVVIDEARPAAPPPPRGNTSYEGPRYPHQGNFYKVKAQSFPFDGQSRPFPNWTAMVC